ncbi:MAG: magnesium and cobalt exporter, family, partial [Solirubrobacteraceae bacterium]|nr:magnesium and cobalt exporter, family [Solirubrobacteraceae bacterium]
MRLLRFGGSVNERRSSSKSRPTRQARPHPVQLTALLLSAVVVLIFLNGFFVAGEFALVRARRGKLEELAAAGDRRAARVVHMLDNLSEYLSACQFGITLASLGIGFLGEPAIAELIKPAIGNLSHAAAVPIAIAIA